MESSFLHIAAEAKGLIAELKVYCEEQISGWEKDVALEKVATLETAFESDCNSIIMRHFHDVISTSPELTLEKKAEEEEEEDEDSLTDLEAELSLMSGAIQVLEREIQEASQAAEAKKTTENSEEERKVEVVHTPSLHPTPEAMETDAVPSSPPPHSSGKLCEFSDDGSFYFFDEEEEEKKNNIKDESVAPVPPGEGANPPSVPTEFMGRSSGDDGGGWKAADDPHALLPSHGFSEPFFSQDENVFDRCIEALRSYECTEALDGPNGGCVVGPRGSHGYPTTDRISPSDETCVAACLPMERPFHGTPDEPTLTSAREVSNEGREIRPEGGKVEPTPTRDSSVPCSVFPDDCRRPHWVLSVSDRIRRSQSLMEKALAFSSALGCNLGCCFNFVSTHLIVCKGERAKQVDLYEALASNRPVVSFHWVEESLKRGRLLDHAPFRIKRGTKPPSATAPEEEEEEDDDQADNFRDALVLEDFQICCSAALDGFSEDDTRRLVEMSGARYVCDPSAFRPSRKKRNLLVVVDDEDPDPRLVHLFSRARKNAKNFETVHGDWLLESIGGGRPMETAGYSCTIPLL